MRIVRLFTRLAEGFWLFKNYIEAMLCRNQNASEMIHVIFVLLFLGLFHSISSQISVKDKRQLVNSCIDGNNHKQEPGPEDSLHQQVMPIFCIILDSF